MSKEIAVSIVLGAALASSFTSVLGNASKKIFSLQDKIQQAGKKTVELGKAIELAGKKTDLESAVAMGDTSAETAKALAKVTRQYEKAAEAARKYGSGVKEWAKEQATANALLDKLKMRSQGFQQIKSGVQSVMPGAAAAALAGKGIASTGMDFDAQMSKVGAVSRATDEQLKTLTATARDLGAKTAWSATQAAEGMQYLAMASFSTTDIVSAMPF